MYFGNELYLFAQNQFQMKVKLMHKVSHLNRWNKSWRVEEGEK